MNTRNFIGILVHILLGAIIIKSACSRQSNGHL